jgi:serine/threonine-protein kinase HipA
MMSEQITLLVQLQKPSGDWVDVGLLRGDGSRNWFESLESYWELADRPVLGQVFEEHGRFWRPNAHVALPRWFSHLLPEGRLRERLLTSPVSASGGSSR